MKFSYPLLKKIFPAAPAKEKTGELLNLRAFEMESIEGNTLDIKLPANRYSDCASHIGVAREIAAASGAKLKYDIKKTGETPSGKGSVAVRVEERVSCPRYAVRVFDIKKIGPSPKDVQKVLADCGVKSINNIVDIMNYVMLETGQPLHAFDFDKLSGSGRGKTIIVRNAKKNEKITTLDGQSLTLDPSVLVIADGEQAQAIAGVKGGMASGVTATTKRIVVEAANFEPIRTFKTARALKLPTDAALRFGHGMSPALVDWGMERATELLKEEGATFIDSAEVTSVKISETAIEFDCAKYEAVIGATVTPSTAKLHFERLGFGIGESKSSGGGRGRFMVRIPAWRNDIENAEGLMEEVARLEGYDTLEAVPPMLSIVPPHEEDEVVLKEKVRAVLTDLGLHEVLNSSFVGEGQVDGKKELVTVENPVSDDKKYLRHAIHPLLKENIAANARYFDVVKLFEIGKVFASIGGKIHEELALGVALGAKKDPRVVLELKGLMQEFLEGLGIDDIIMAEHKGKIRVEADGVLLGVIEHAAGEKQWSLALAEFNLENVLRAMEEEKEYVPLSRFPAVVRDISILVGREVRIGDAMEAVSGANRKIIESVDLIDEYKDEKLGGKQSLTFRIIFQAHDRTLTDAEVNGEMEKIAAALKKAFRAEVR